MSLYSKPSRELVYDLINLANPNLPYAVKQANIAFSAPVAVTGAGSSINTEVIGRALPNSEYVGKQTFRYLRLVLGTLFRGMTVEVHKYSEALSGNTNGSTVMFTIHQLLADINTKFGLNLTTDDVANGNITRGNTQNGEGRYTNTVTVNAAATSLGWTGSFQLKWVEAPRGIDTMINVVDLNGLAYPGGNDFEAEHPMILNSMAYGIDWTDLAEANKWSGYPAPFGKSSLPSSTTAKPFYNAVSEQLRQLYPDLASKIQTDWFLLGTHHCVTLPSAAYPEANSADNNRLIVITPPAARTDLVGAMYLHFNA